MNIWDILIILVVAAAVFVAVRHVVKTRRSGGCGCGCEGCTKGSCPDRKDRQE